MNSGSPSRQDLPSTSAGAAGTVGPPSGQRKERGAIAAQACDTCRSRKQKCDERRPKCSTCLRFELECHYREVQPTKKDKTMVEILDIVKGIGGDQSVLEAVLQLDRKFDSRFENLLLRLRDILSSNVYGAVHATALVPVHHEPLNPVGFDPPSQSDFSIPSHAAPTSVNDSPYKYVSSASRMLAWPVVQQLFNAVASKIPTLHPSTIERDGPSFFLGTHGDPMALSREINPSGAFSTEGRSRASQKQPATSAAHHGRMQRLSKAYFDTFHFVYPILDRQMFQASVLARVLRDGFDNGIESTLAFLVFALGEVALAGTHGPPVDVYNTRPSGLRGGTLETPPGLDLFNEARKRMGFNLTECSLENVQVLALASIYYGTNSHHTDLWRTAAMASLACQALILGKSINLETPQGDLLKRAFWHCCLVETFSDLNLEFNNPLTGLEKLEGVIGMPHFNSPFSEEDFVANEASHFQEHFAAQIALRRLVVDFHNILSQGPPPQLNLQPSGTPHVLESHTIKYFAVQLEQWRALLPAQLYWDADQPAASPGASREMYANPPAPAIFAPSGSIFTADLDAPPVVYQHAADIQTAILRTRYYFARHLLHRPFVYKALHFPGQVTDEDAQGVAQCLRTGLRWPLAMSPPSRHKRLVPGLFLWSQNLLGVLLLLSLSQQVPILLRIRSTMCGERFDVDAGETVALYIDWIRDLSGADPAARWCWEVVKAVYRLDDE